MKGKFISRFMDNPNRNAIILLVLAVILLVSSIFLKGPEAASMKRLLWFGGLISLFFALLNTWGDMRRIYYVMLMVISVLLFVLLLFVGIDILIKMQLPGHGAEDMAWFLGSFCIIGFLAGVFGLLLYQK